MNNQTSNCCDAPKLYETGLCSKCKEHAEFEQHGKAPDPEWVRGCVEALRFASYEDSGKTYVGDPDAPILLDDAIQYFENLKEAS